MKYSHQRLSNAELLRIVTEGTDRGYTGEAVASAQKELATRGELTPEDIHAAALFAGTRSPIIEAAERLEKDLGLSKRVFEVVRFLLAACLVLLLPFPLGALAAGAVYALLGAVWRAPTREHPIQQHSHSTEEHGTRGG